MAPQETLFGIGQKRDVVRFNTPGSVTNQRSQWMGAHQGVQNLWSLLFKVLG
jgi:hypothetical protein